MSVAEDSYEVLHPLAPKKFLLKAARRVQRIADRWNPRVLARRPCGISEWRELAVPCGEVDRFLGEITDPVRFSAPLRRGWCEGTGGIASQVLADAERLASGTIRLLGREVAGLPADAEDWWSDPRGTTVWRYQSPAGNRPAPFPGGADIKVPWELSRLHPLVTFGTAYQLTRDERWVSAWKLLLDSWLDFNPPLRGVAWASPMDTSIRAVSIVVSAAMVGRASIAESAMSLALGAVKAHVEFVISHLEWERRYRGNHYYADLCGLAIASALTDAATSRRSVLAFTMAELERETCAQFASDGLNTESSLGYHRFMTEMAISTWSLLSRVLRMPIPTRVQMRLTSAVDGLRLLSMPDGRLPAVGDDDSGRFLTYGMPWRASPEQRDGTYLEVAWSAVSKKPMQYIAEPLSWWEGCAIAGDVAPEPISDDGRSRPPVVAFASGLSVARSQHSCVLLVASGAGQGGRGGHAHEDQLAVELWLRGRAIFVDRGPGGYTADYELRDRLRSVRSHSTIEIDGALPSRRDARLPFALCNYAEPVLTSFGGGEGSQVSAAVELEKGDQIVVFKRSAILDADGDGVVIEDRLEGEGLIRLVSRFHLAPDMSLAVDSPGVLTLGSPEPVLLSWDHDVLRMRIVACEHSTAYGEVQAATAIELFAEVNLPFVSRVLLRCSPPNITAMTVTGNA